MPEAKAEIAYLGHRLAVTISQRDNASGECSKASHDGLVKLYRYRVVSQFEFTEVDQNRSQ